MLVKQRFSVFSDTVKKFADNKKVAAAVTGFCDQFFLLIVPGRHIEIVRFLSFGDVPLVVAEHYFAARTAKIFDLTLVATKSEGKQRNKLFRLSA